MPVPPWGMGIAAPAGAADAAAEELISGLSALGPDRYGDYSWPVQ
ncbi:hypothetical protein [Streptomyces sp. NPDC005209]